MARAVNEMSSQQFRQLQHDLQAKRAQNQFKGKRNRDLGKLFEDMISRACDFYREVGDADIEKTPEPMRVLRPIEGGKFISCFEKQAQPDYKGVTKGGQAVLFDAKHTTCEQIKQSAVTDVQAAALDRSMKLGAECFVLVGFNMAYFYRIPWYVWRDMKAYFGRKYIRADELEEYYIKRGKSGILLFLD